MSEANRALVRRFEVEWLNRHSLEAFHEVCHPDIAFHWGALGDGRGVDAMQALEEKARIAFPDMNVSTDWDLATDEYVIQRVTVTGTHGGPWFGVEATGKPARWTAVAIYRVADGKLAEMWLNEDWAFVLQQLGALPDA